MNILLINPPGKISFISPPLGLLYIAASLKEDGHNVSIVDYNLEKIKQDDLCRIVVERKIEAVGISVVTPKVHGAMELAKFVKRKFPEIIVIAGGPHATLVPEELMKECPAIDFIIQGEGEIRSKELFSKLKNKTDYGNVDGLVFRRGGQIINNKAKDYIADLNTLAMPAREVVDIKHYASKLKTSVYPATTMMTSRGCPFRCIYCSKPVTGSRIRSVSPEKVLEEIEKLVSRHGIREIIFYDDSFTVDKPRIMKICDMILKRKIKIRWQCETRVNLVDQEMLNKMKEAGCYLVAYGIESGSDRVLAILKKGIIKEQVIKAIEISKKASIQIIGYFMMGIPGETEEEIKQTISFAKELDIDFAQFSIATAYPGTELYQIAKAQNKINPDWSKSIYALGGKPLISLSDVPVDKLYYYIKKAYSSFYFRPAYILKKINSIKSIRDLIYNARGLFTLLKI